MATAGILILRSQNRYQDRFSHNNNAIHETAMQRKKKKKKQITTLFLHKEKKEGKDNTQIFKGTRIIVPVHIVNNH